MSETTQSTVQDLDESTVEDFEDEMRTAGTEENHTPILPEKDGTEAGGDEGVTTMENHTPIAPARGEGN